MEIPESKIKYICGLSNGETLTEGKGVLVKKKGEPSSWWKLQDYLKENDLTIHSFNLWVGDRHYNLPSISPKFGGEIPLSYNCYRKYAGDVLVGSGNVEHYICAEAIYEDYKVQVWIDEQDYNKAWVNVVSKQNAKKKNKS